MTPPFIIKWSLRCLRISVFLLATVSVNKAHLITYAWRFTDVPGTVIVVVNRSKFRRCDAREMMYRFVYLLYDALVFVNCTVLRWESNYVMYHERVVKCENNGWIMKKTAYLRCSREVAAYLQMKKKQRIKFEL